MLQRLHHAWLIGTILLSLFFVQCKPDENPPIPIEGPQEAMSEEERFNLVLPSTSRLADFIVFVDDESGSPIQSALIKIGLQQASTNELGYASFKNVEVNATYAKVSASLEGYFDAFKTFTPSEKNNVVKLVLMERGQATTFNASSEGNLSTNNGKVQLNFQANSLLTMSGQPFSGEVHVYSRYLDPASNETAFVLPGGLEGLDSSNQMMALETFGMVYIELEDAAGNELTLNEGSTAELRLPASGNAPNDIPLWHFNETYGLWIEIGEAQRQGAEFVTDLSHFSIYNLDLAYNPAELTVILRDQNLFYIKNTEVLLTIDNLNYIRTVHTDDQGTFTIINAPTDQELGLIFSSDTCNTLNFSQEYNLGTITEDKVVTLTIDFEDFSVHTHNLYGQVMDCDEMPLTDATLVLNIEEPANPLPGEETISAFLLTHTDQEGNYDDIIKYCNPQTFQMPRVYGFVETWEMGQYHSVFIDTVLDLSGIQSSFTIDICQATDSTDPDAEVIEFNECLQNLLENELNHEGAFSRNQLRTITQLRVHCSDLDGLEKLENLAHLDLHNNSTTDLGPVGQLEKLESLNLTYCEDALDLSPLQNLTNLHILDASNMDQQGNGVSFSDLGALTELRHLILRGNYHIQDFSFLNSLTNLNYLSLESTKAIAYGGSVIGGMNWLDSLVLEANDFPDVPVQDISFLSNLTDLTYLDLSNNDGLVDVSPLSNISNLQVLSLRRCNTLSSLNGLEGLTSLLEFRCDKTNVVDYSPLSNLTQLTVLTLGDPHSLPTIPDLSQLQNLVNLTFLDLSEQSLTDISSLSGMILLEDLDLRQNNISDLSALSGMTVMDKLDLENNMISSGISLCDWPDSSEATVILVGNLLDNQAQQELMNCLPDVAFEF